MPDGRNGQENDLQSEQLSRRENSCPPIEEVLCKRKVLIFKSVALAKEGELNISAIVKETNVNPTRINDHLIILQKAGLIREKRFGRIRIIKYNDEKLQAKALKRLIEEWG